MSSETDSPRPPIRSRDFESRRIYGLLGGGQLSPGDFLSAPGNNDDVPSFSLDTLPTRLMDTPSMNLRAAAWGSRHSRHSPQLFSEPLPANLGSVSETLGRGVQPSFSRSTRRSTQSRSSRRTVAVAATSAVVAPPAAASRPRTRRSTRVATMACAARAASAMSSFPKDENPSKRRAASRKRPPPESSSPSPPKKPRTSLKKPPVNAKNDADYEDAASPETADASCCICMCEPTREEVSTIDGCEHMFCFGCIGKWADRENSCPLCKKRFTKITRVHPVKRKKGGKKSPNSKRVKQRDQRSDYINGTSLEGLLASLATSGSMPGGARMSRFIVARMGVVGGPPSMPASRGARVTFSLNQFLADADDDDDDDDFSQFNFFMHSQTTSSARAHAPFAASVPSRSYATNANDRTAGRNPSNPLEIDDSDDDDVEILRVSRSA